MSDLPLTPRGTEAIDGGRDAGGTAPPAEGTVARGLGSRVHARFGQAAGARLGLPTRDEAPRYAELA